MKLPHFEAVAPKVTPFFFRSLLVLCLAFFKLSAVGRDGVAPTGSEMRQKGDWMRENLQRPSIRVPFSFTLGGRSSTELLTTWTARTVCRKLDSTRKESTVTWSDPAGGVQILCTSVDYADYPAVEWTVRIRNTGKSETPVLEHLNGLDISLKHSPKAGFLLHGVKGDSCTADSYEPYNLPLPPGFTKQFSPPGHSGKSCDGPAGWPYYNLQWADRGVILAVGWPGQWSSTFTRDSSDGLRITAGQQTLRMRLMPGEEIRTPLIALLFWRGNDVVRSQNLWRRWYLAHTLPRVGGEPQGPIAQIQVDGSPSATNYVKAFLDAGIQPSLCWRDAGGAYTWYPNTNGPYKDGDSWLNTGTWEVDPSRYPEGFRPFSDWVRSKKMQFLLWFEPERVGDPQCWLATKHPEWMLPGSSHGSILNLGNPAALSWLVDHIDTMIKTQGIDWYREDMNGGGPLPAWQKNDGPDRAGSTENFYVQGHLAFWDALRHRHPGLHIDSCASGGRRNDLETMRRAVPLLRSDFQFPEMKGVVEGNQGHTFGLSSWLPFQGTGCYLHDPYAFRSFYLPSFGMGGLNPENAPAQKKAYGECARIAPLMLGDYYPLTAYSLQPDRWIGWQFNRPGQGDGMVQVFRRAKCDQSIITLRLSGLRRSAQYEFTNFDAEGTCEVSGADLMKNGLKVEINSKPGSAVLTYRLKSGKSGHKAHP